ncbi:ArfGap-domain-containing protein [Punctularia strigosozonata HHB-11173 SS5]|uniref:ArfGap-domain-containing protein n=1 Tax=Punctularia strigosozonata (strain HHB-11173) TaxID=741275 RepID=UPI0004417038|nr:ArfGap-domain-containing protein [Punctularia strigosozonata HHB-11173 SS5]EIN13278.1 ArfGap-domain-containing protein [Punctularia strigosozonata HHB-11173 SS5]
MSTKQDKATTERHARILREMLKRPENKVCADCKRNDPRWASWNIGCFVCIRCSGIHRSMGTHISKVKSVDLDTWTPEQMEHIQKWGNRRANLYWESHLKAGHIPPDHKMDSFIRSKYETRRWAMDGPPPSDPSVLEDGEAAPPAQSTSPPPQVQPARTSHAHSSSSSFRTTVTSTQPQPRQLLSQQHMQHTRTATPPIIANPQQKVHAPQQQQAPAPVPEPQNDLFSLDFHAPANPTASTASSAGPKKDVKSDILSLFSASSPAAAPAQPTAFGQFGQAAPVAAAADPWGAFGSTPTAAQPSPAQTSMMGTSGAGMWGVSSGWNTTASQPHAANNLWGSAPAASPAALNVGSTVGLGGSNVWGVQPQQPAANNFMASTNDIWGGSSSGGADLFGSAPAAPAPAKKQDDAFGDIWGGFK